MTNLITEARITKDDIFKLMCNTTACAMNYQTDLMPSTIMAAHFKCSRYRIKKLLQELAADGLIKSGYESCYSDWTEQHYIVRGYRLTKKGRESDIYKAAEAKELILLKECFGGAV